MTLIFVPPRIDPFLALLFKSFAVLRRLLRKQGDRYEHFIETMNLAILSKKTNIVGPVHGFLDACRYLGITIAVENNGLRLVSPHGTGIDVLGNDRTLYNLVVRDSVQYAILQQLEECTSSPERTRY